MEVRWSDGAMVDRIDRAEEGDHIAICTIDGNLMPDATGCLVPGIAAALLRAAEKRRVRIWLFTFAGLGTPGPDLLLAVEQENWFECRFSSVDGYPSLSVMRPGSSDTPILRTLDTGWA